MKNNLNKVIDYELMKSMLASFLGTHVLDDIIIFFVDTFIAVILGRLTNAIVTHDIEYLKSNVIMITVCLLFRIFCEPLLFAFFSARSVYGSSEFIRKLLSHYLDKPYATISDNQAGDIPSRINSDIIDFVREKLKQTADRMLLPVFTVYLIVVLSGYNYIYSAVSVFAVALSYTAPIVARKVLAKYDMSQREYNSAYNTTETELVSDASEIKSMKLDEVLTSKMEKLFDIFYRNIFLNKLRCQSVTETISSISMFSSQMVIIITGAFLLGSSRISAGEVSALLSLTGSVTFLLDKASGLITVKPRLNNLYTRLEFFYSEGDLDEQILNDETVCDMHENIVECHDLCMKHDDRIIFENVSFSIPRNKITLLKGANGSGKSTLISCICGFDIPENGNIIIDGRKQCDQNIKIISLSSPDSVLFRYIGMRDNILLGSNEKDNSEYMDRIINEFGLDNVDSEIEDMSGGESQKAKLIRAMIKDAQLLILDEPENHLDEKTVSVLVSELKKLKKTVLVVSHYHVFDMIADYVVEL